MEFWALFFSHPIVIAGGSVLTVALANAVVRQVGSGAKTQPRLIALEKKAAIAEELPVRVLNLETQETELRQFQRTILIVSDHHTAALTILLEKAKGKRMNGNLDHALQRMDEARRETSEYLVESATASKN